MEWLINMALYWIPLIVAGFVVALSTVNSPKEWSQAKVMRTSILKGVLVGLILQIPVIFYQYYYYWG